MRKIKFTRGSLYRLLILIALGAGALWLSDFMHSRAKLAEMPMVTQAQKPAPAPLKILLRAGDSYLCEQGSCKQQPALHDGEILEDGWEYYYEEKQAPDSKNPAATKIYLRRSKADGTTETIMESTPLTSPRGLYPSPDGQHVAFWLDNTGDPKAELTELWVYDSQEKGVRLLAEKVYRPDVRSEVTWNAAGTYLWFIADTGAQTLLRDQLELVVVNAAAPGLHASFPHAPWNELSPALEAAHVELSQRADHLAYVTRTLLGKPVIVLETPEGGQRTNLRGQVKYMQWQEDDSLFYALQDDQGFAFWRVRGGLHQFIARRPGKLIAARSDPGGEQIVFATRTQQAIDLFSLHIPSGMVAEQGRVPASDADLTIFWVEALPAQATEPQAGGAGDLDDGQIAAFIDANFANIAGDTGAVPLRLIITDVPNVVFLDYRAPSGAERRLQVKIYDTVNTEWSVTARYEPVNREWKKVQGSGLADPAPLRLYEWEESLKQWVLKSSV